jgi:hypothetical protein
MEREFEEGEVWEVVWNFKGDKASGPDGITMVFFQKCWEVLKADIIAVLKEFHNSGKFEKSLNATNKFDRWNIQNDIEGSGKLVEVNIG